ncbi:MAG TPA: bifunctional 4-hydroxy-2-oxoglutarate aldolase/2-dehydro-3-deoxy-phosphogluconate aldolase [Polyangiaceae bacterium]|jgi:2-dehydro-3-deoxyphosphogluconate aldolase/(4S)-4-hydroxy-2-oxoglutarate aldolase
MQKREVVRRIAESGVIPVVRVRTQDSALRAIEALVEGGIDVVEVTMTIPRATVVLEELSKRFGGAVLLGAGTVLDAETARACLLAGASFLVSPIADEALIRCGRTYGAPVLAGALTPTEIVCAWRAGADLIKVFPCAALGGPAYVKALKGPLPQIDLVPTGGVSLDNVGAFLRAGAIAVGAGTDLVDPHAPPGEESAVRERARRYRDAVSEARAG